jgi:phage shock protein PspC (stress-responsive transcriptional regulator)
MEKAINITINGQVFYIEENGYEKLAEYLDSVKEHFSSMDEEIVKDIEGRIAERFSSKTSSKKEVITLKDVQSVIKSMGDVDDMDDFEEPEQPKKKPKKTRKRLMRDPDDAMIAGVASGVAAYFDIDPILIRLAFALSLLAGGTGLVIYIVMWLIVPEAKSAANKLEMRGEHVTLKKIEKEVKKKAEEMREPANRFGIFLKRFFAVVGKIALILLKIILILTGIALLIAAVAAIVGTIFAVTTVGFNLNSPHLGLPISLSGIFTGPMLALAIISLAIAALVPLIFILGAGLSLLRRRWAFSAVFAITLLALWFISLTVGSALAIQAAPEIERRVEDYEANIDEKTVEIVIGDFDEIRVGSLVSELNVYKSVKPKLVVTAPERLMSQIDVEIDDGTLVISRENYFCFFCFHYPEIKIDAYSPQINSLDLGGATHLTMENLNQKDLEIDLRGAVSGLITGKIDNIEGELSGASRLNLEGSGDYLEIEVSGASNLKAKEFKLQELFIELSGVSKATVFVEDSIEAYLSGASELRYKGDADIDFRTSGASDVDKI